MRERYIIQCTKIPKEERDIYRSFEQPAFRNIKRVAEVGDKAVYAVDLSEREADKATEASNLISISKPAIRYNHVGTTIPSSADLTFHKADQYLNWGWTGAGIVIGVIDSGLASAVRSMFNIKAAKSFVQVDPYDDSVGHGTSVSALAVPRDAQLVVANVQLHGSSSSSVEHTTEAIYWMVDEVGVDFINYSSGGKDPDNAEHDAVIHAKNAGVPFYTTAGNEGKSGSEYPGRFPEAISVGALDRSTGQHWSGSNYGEGVDVWASGVGVHTMNTSGGAATATGTSVAAPIAVWLAASQAGKTKPNDVTPQQVADNMASNPMNDPTVDPDNYTYPNPSSGSGITGVPDGNPNNAPIGLGALDGLGSLPSLKDFC